MGDPWYREVHDDEPGLSLLVVRTERGRRYLRAARAAGAISARQVTGSHLPASQPGLHKVRGAVWGRIAMSRILGIPAPSYRGLSTFPVWWRSLPLAEKLRSTVGLVRRVGRRGLRHRHPVVPLRQAGDSDGEAGG